MYVYVVKNLKCKTQMHLRRGRKCGLNKYLNRCCSRSPFLIDIKRFVICYNIQTLYTCVFSVKLMVQIFTQVMAEAAGSTKPPDIVVFPEAVLWIASFGNGSSVNWTEARRCVPNPNPNPDPNPNSGVQARTCAANHGGAARDPPDTLQRKYRGQVCGHTYVQHIHTHT